MSDSQQERITFLERQNADLNEALAKAMEVVRKAACHAFLLEPAPGTTSHRIYCMACGQLAPAGTDIQHLESCQVLWLRHHGLT